MDSSSYITPGSSADVYSTADLNGGTPAAAYGAEYNQFGVKTNLTIPLTQTTSANNAGVRSVVGDASPSTTPGPVSPSDNVQSSANMGFQIGTGWWMGFDGGIPKFFLGTEGGNNVSWDGTALTIRGQLIAGSIDIPDTTSPGSFHVDSSGNTWWGATTFANALASVTNTGQASFQGVRVINSKISTDFETSARFVGSVGGTGTRNFVNTGILMGITSGGTGFARNLWTITAGGNVSSINFKFSTTIVANSTLGNTSSIYCGLGAITVSASGHTFTNNHIGFKVLTTSTTRTLLATQATGGVETTASLTALSIGDTLDLFLVVNSTSVDYYYRIITTATPSTFTKTTINTTPYANVDQGFIQYSVSGDGTSQDVDYYNVGASIER